MNAQKLIDTAKALIAGDKGLLAMNESNPTCNKRFARLGIPQTESGRRAYRELIVTTPGFDDRGGPVLVERDDPLVKSDVLVEFGLLAQERRKEAQARNVLAEDRQAERQGCLK